MQALVDCYVQQVGCDQIVGSNLTHDVCGVCGGDNSGCIHYSSNYTHFPADAGKIYATNIKYGLLRKFVGLLRTTFKL